MTSCAFNVNRVSVQGRTYFSQIESLRVQIKLDVLFDSLYELVTFWMFMEMESVVHGQKKLCDVNGYGPLMRISRRELTQCFCTVLIFVRARVGFGTLVSFSFHSSNQSLHVGMRLTGMATPDV